MRPDRDDRLMGLRLTRPPQVISREVGECLMVIDVQTGFTYEANWLGAQAWRLLCQGNTVQEACRVLAQAHRYSRDAVERDVVALVRDLVGYGLASAEPPRPETGAEAMAGVVEPPRGTALSPR